MVTVIMVGYNSQRYLHLSLTSLMESSYQALRIIYVDNNSSDNSIAYIRQNFPRVNIIRNEKNLGYAHANNIGINEALRQKTDYLLLINPDTVIDKYCIAHLVKNGDKRSILQPLVLLYSKGKTHRVNSLGNYVNFLGMSHCRGFNSDAHGLTRRQIPSASGAAMFLPREVFGDIGLFDEAFFMYHEDLDLCWRARKAGWEILLIPEARIWHDYAFSRNAKKMYYVERNRLLFLYKNFETKTLLLLLPSLMLNELLACSFAMKEGYLREKLATYLSFIQLAPHYTRLRKQTTQCSQRKDKELKAFLGAHLQFAPVDIPFVSLYNRFLDLYWSFVSRYI